MAHNQIAVRFVVSMAIQNAARFESVNEYAIYLLGHNQIVVCFVFLMAVENAARFESVNEHLEQSGETFTCNLHMLARR